MFSAAPKNDGSTLFVSQLSHGLVFTLAIREVGQSGNETHVWKTSYPLLDLLFPQWLPKVPINTPIDFFGQSLEHAEKAFGWKLKAGGRLFRMPETSFGDGLSQVVILQEKNAYPIDFSGAVGAGVLVLPRSQVVLHELLMPRLADFSEKVVLVVLDFDGVEIVECEPRFIGSYKRWEYKTAKIEFETVQHFIDHIAAKHFMPFVGENLSEGQIFNLILNHTYWKPVTTSSALVKDIWRAIITSLLTEIAPYTAIQKGSAGHIFVTGEVPVFLEDPERLQLALIDGLGLHGMWSVTCDYYSQYLPYLIAHREQDTIHEFYGADTNMWIIPQLQKSTDFVKVDSGSSNITAFSGNLYTFNNHESGHDISYTAGSKKHDIKVPKGMRVKSVIVDARPWPVVYGPNPTSNGGRIKQWLDRLKKIIEPGEKHGKNS